MRRRPLTLVALTALLVGIGGVTPAVAEGPPRTLAAEAALGAVAAPSRVVPTDFPVEHLGISWTGVGQVEVRFSISGTWSPWQEVEDDGLPARGRSFGHLLDGGDARAYQVRGWADDVRAVAINTTDGSRTFQPRAVQAEATLEQPALVSRAQWGADENLRFNSGGTEVWPPTFHPTQKLIVHHTATKNDDPDPAATVRAIYRYHAVDKGWGDIGYNFLVDAQGRIYKGRWSGPAGSTTGDSLTGEDADGRGVTGAHVGGWNSGTMGIAVLGDYDKAVKPSAASLQALVDHLAWESERHGLDPEASSTFTNPVSGDTKDVSNISAHRDWASTACPGRHLYPELPGIRADVAAKLPPATPTGLTAGSGGGTATLDWADSPDSDLADYLVERSTDDGLTWSALPPVTVSSYLDSGLTNGTQYSYRVSARDTTGLVSDPTPPVAVTPAVPTATVTTETVDDAVVEKGSTTETATVDLDHDEGSTYDVATERQGRTHVAQWTARVDLADATTVTNLAVVLSGGSTEPVTRTLSAYDHDAAAWVEVESTSVAAEVQDVWETSEPRFFRAGSLQVRIRATASSPAVTGTDLLVADATRST